MLTGGGATFDAIQPQYVFRLNTEGKTAEELLMSLPQSTRRKGPAPGAKKGVTVEIKGKEAVPDFARLMLETGGADGFVTREASYFENMLDNLGEHAGCTWLTTRARPLPVRWRFGTATRCGISTAHPPTSTGT